MTMVPKWRWAKVGLEQQEGLRERPATRFCAGFIRLFASSLNVCSGPKMALMAHGSKV